MQTVPVEYLLTQLKNHSKMWSLYHDCFDQFLFRSAHLYEALVPKISLCLSLFELIQYLTDYLSDSKMV